MITIYNSNLDFDLDSSNSITLSSTSNLIFKTNGSDKMTILDNGISVSGNVVVSGLITSTGAGFSGIGANLTNIPISAINELRLELNGSTTDLSVTRDALTSRIVSEVGFGSNYTGRINSELNTRVDNTSNYVLATSNILIGRIINTSNYVDSTSNFLSGRIDNTSNYALATSNILIGRIINTSNYVDSTSNFLSGRIDNTSNYVLSTSNILIGRIINTSNYLESTSNTLIGRIINTSNYVESTSNTLIGRIINTSNYVDSTSNLLSSRIDNTSNYVLATSNLLIARIDNTSNYVLATSNLLSGRIDNTSNYVLTTSNILIARIINTSNYVDSTSNLLSGRIDNASNYVLATSNLLANYNNLINKPFQFNATNIFYNAGNVGIGTDAPLSSYRLQVQGNAWVEKQLVFNNSYRGGAGGANYACNKISLYGGGNTPTTTSGAGEAFGFGIGAGGILDYFSAGSHLWYSGTTGGTNYGIERMRIATDGNVGIGTTDTATYKLNVGGTLNTTELYVSGSALTTTIALKQDVLTSANTIGVFNTTTDFVVNGSKIELTKNTSNYVLATSNILIGRIDNTSNYSDRVGVWSSNYTDRIGERSSNYVLATSNILISRIINTSNYVSSYKPLTAVRADTATALFTSRRIANVPFDGSADINISYNSLQDILTAGNGITILNNQISANAAPQEQSDWNITTQSSVSFIRNKPDLTIIATNNTNTSNYVLATSNLLANYNNLINKPFQFNATNIFYNAGNVGIGTDAPQSSYKLQVQGNAWVENQLVFNNTYRGASYAADIANYACNKISLYNGGNTPITSSQFGFGVAIGFLEYFSSGGHIWFSETPGGTNYGIERMRIATGGNVGIGTTDTATYKLNVGGTLNTTDLFVNGSALTTTISLKQDVLTSANTIGVFNTTTDFVVNGSKIELTKNTSNYVLATSNILIGRIDNTSNYSDKVGGWGSNYTDRVGGWGSNYADRVGGWGSNYAYDKVGVWSSNYSDRVGGWGSNYVLATSNILIGRVINTSNYVSSYKPATAVLADTATAMAAGSVVAVANGGTGASTFTAGGLITGNTTGVLQQYAGLSYTSGTTTLNSPNLAISTNANIIGNVGIGTATIQSSYKLQVQGNTWVENQLVFNNSYKGGAGGADFACNKISLWGSDNTPTTIAQFGFGVALGSRLEYFSSGTHAFYTGTSGGTNYGTERMRIATGGNVGIGTTDTATYKLNVGGTLNTTGLFVNGSEFTGSSQWTGTTDIYNNTGNVGIGTTDTTYKLNTIDNISIQNSSSSSTLPPPLFATLPTGVTTGTIGTTDRFYVFTHTGTFNSNTQYQNIEIPFGITFDLFMIGGGGAGGGIGGAGGGSGACLVAVNQTLLSTLKYTFIVGGSGNAGTSEGNSGYDTLIARPPNTVIYRARGGGGGEGDAGNGFVGGCSGGAAGNNSSTNFTSPGVASDNIYNTASYGPKVDNTLEYGIYGNKGGDAAGTLEGFNAVNYGGGGGIGVAAANATGGNSTAGGDGLYQVTINQKTYNLRTYFTNNGTFGVQDGTTGNYFIGGGGGGGGFTPTNIATINGGKGGGGKGYRNKINQNGESAQANTGSGGGGGSTGSGGDSYGGSGGSGLLIIRYRNVSNAFVLSYSTGIEDDTKLVISNRTSPTSYIKCLAISRNGDVNLPGTLTASSKSWRIKHPILTNKYLLHTCIEGTRADNIYRGRKQLIDGECEVNIDLECNNTGGMTEGTFELINKNVQVYVINNDTYDRVVGKINGNKLTIKSENNKASCFIDWLVIGERCDEYIMSSMMTDASGSIIVEFDMDTSNIIVDTSNIIVDTSSIIVDTSNIIVNTSNIIVDTSNIIVNTSNIIVDTSNIIVDTSNIIVE